MRAGLWLRLAGAGALDPAANQRVQGLATWLAENRPAGVLDAVPGYASLYVEFDPRVTTEARLRCLLDGVSIGNAAGRLVEIPVNYDGPDLAAAASSTGLEPGELIQLHSAGEYHVYSTSFSPGMPLAGALDPRLELPRRAEPRKRVEAGSVAIAGAQTGVYAVPSPGGWNVLGTALANLYDPALPDPFLVRPLDRIKFRPETGRPPALPSMLELLPERPERPRLRVLKSGPLDLIVDRGRPWGGLHGLAEAGAADPSASAIANALLGNHPDAPLLEINLLGPSLEVCRTMVAVVTGDALLPVVDGEVRPAWTSLLLERGTRLDFRPTGRGARSYLAIAGGIESAEFMGSRSTDLKGLVGRPLRAGDLLGAAQESGALPGRTYRGYRPGQPGRLVTLTVAPGPQFGPGVAEAIAGQSFAVGSADRMGVRLTGGQLPGGELVSEATPLGTVQVTPGGIPMILLNDRGRVGGYAKPLTVTWASLPLAAQLTTGDRVRFRLLTGH